MTEKTFAVPLLPVHPNPRRKIIDLSYLQTFEGGETHISPDINF